MTQFCITVRWLDDRYHGLLDRDGPPEWPPSPFRLFQALVAGVGRRGELDSEMGKSLEWLQSLGPPIIVAPRSVPGLVITRFVPNNDGDKVLDRQKRLTGKTSRPTIILDPPGIHYLWPIQRDDCPQVRRLIEASRCLSCFGWGIDMAYGYGQLLDDEQTGKLNGVRWFPKPNTLQDDGLLRVPKEGSMADLRRAHQSALTRIEHGKPLRTIHKPQVFDRVFYASTERPIGPPCVVFALRTNDDDPYRYPHAKLIHIAGMTRRAAIKAMKDYPPEEVDNALAWVESFVAGHRPDGIDLHNRFSYVPLPSIGHEHADAMIRRVMIIAPYGHEAQLGHLANQLDGAQLEPEDGSEGPVLCRLHSDVFTRQYLDPCRMWASVTPVILPGHDDHKPTKTIKLIQRALLQSGVEHHCRFSWSAAPNFKHCLTAHKYDREKRHVGYYRPGHLESMTAVHIGVNFEHPVAGPLSIGAGRHCGLGVLARKTA